ncbi:MAG: hypothetical protein AB7F20_14000 [Geoalkalibacter sp.]|uniref:hypothetical protein n=1 Tax=Geoalkalibacter sp. TaxID=3041440 RepID=UPI003D13D8D7
MKTRRNLPRRLRTTVLICVLALATPALAWMGNGWNDRAGYNQGAVNAPSLSADQQNEIDRVQTKYQSQLNGLQQKLDAKSSELAAARADGNTTMAHINSLESEIFQLERQYWTLLDRANAEATAITGNTQGHYFTCGYTGCNHRHHAGSTGKSGRRRNCCW